MTKFSPANNTFSSITPATLRCVWMTAGILSYQLCDRKFECDKCPLDAAMRMHYAKHDENMQPRDRQSKHSPEIPQHREYWYSRNHCWVRPLPDGAVSVGLEPGFASLLTSPKAIVLPAVGEIIKHGQWCFWIVLDGGTIPIRAPLSGTICAVHNSLLKDPYDAISHSLNEGWLFEVEVHEDEALRSHLMKSDEAEKLFMLDARRFEILVGKALQQKNNNIGSTFQDGGELLSDISAMLGPKRYFEILHQAYLNSSLP